MDRLVSIIERVQARKPHRMAGYYAEDERTGRVRPVLIGDGQDSDEDT